MELSKNGKSGIGAHFPQKNPEKPNALSTKLRNLLQSPEKPRKPTIKSNKTPPKEPSALQKTFFTILKSIFPSAFIATLSFLLPTVIFSLLSFFILIFDPSSNTDGSSLWSSAISSGLYIFMSGTFAHIELSGLDIAIAPLGITLVLLVFCYTCYKGNLKNSKELYIISTLLYATISFLLVALKTNNTSNGLTSALGSVCIFAVGAGFSFFKNSNIKCIHLVKERVYYGVIMLYSIVIAGFVVTIFLTIIGRGTIDKIYSLLHIDAVNGVFLSIAQLLYLPNLVVWLLGWASGVGFYFGNNAHFSIFNSTNTNLPTIPMLGAFPDDSIINNNVLRLIPILCILLLGATIAYRVITVKSERFLQTFSSVSPDDTTKNISELVDKPTITFSKPPISFRLVILIVNYILCSDIFVFVFCLLLGVASSGSLGVNTLKTVGVNPLIFAFFITLELLIGQLIVFLAWFVYKFFSKSKVKLSLT
jgi:hypothetical protein